MSSKLLLVGCACDGPTETPLPAEDVERTFGAFRYQRATLSPASTSVTLDGEPWDGSVEAFTEDYCELEPYTLHNLSVSGSTASFSRAGETAQVIFKYLRTPQAWDLSKGWRETLAAPEAQVYLLRLGGTTASTVLGTGSARLELSSTYAGTLYNGTSVSVSGSNMLITPPPAHGMARSYDLSRGVEDLAADINLDRDRGYLPLSAAGSGSGTLTGVSSANLSGGTDGAMTPALLESALSRMDLHRYGVICVVGGRWDQLSGVASDAFLRSLPTPVMFVSACQERLEGVSSGDYAEQLLAASPSSHYISLTASECLFAPRGGVSYWGPMSTAYAAALAGSSGFPSWKPLGCSDHLPHYSSAYVSSLSEAGYVVANRSISRGVSVYRGVTTDPDWSLAAFIAFKEACDGLRERLEPAVGENDVSRAWVEAAVEEALSSIEVLRDYDYTVELLPGLIDVWIRLGVVGELREISFRVGVNHA